MVIVESQFRKIENTFCLRFILSDTSKRLIIDTRRFLILRTIKFIIRGKSFLPCAPVLSDIGEYRLLKECDFGE